MMNTRRNAAFIVAKWIASGGFPDEMLPSSGTDRAFVQDLVYTTIRRRRVLRSVLGQLVKVWPKGEAEALLLIGAAQLFYMPDVPDYAAVNETVEAAKACPNHSVSKLVNGVLRNVIRRKEELTGIIAAYPLAKRESYPDSLVDRWIARYGMENAAALAKWHNLPAKTYLAYPPGANPAGDFVELERGKKVAEVEGFADGAFIVQDPATAGAVALMDVQPGMSVLDFCAAPGGKTIQLAWRMKENGRLVAQEVNPKRLRRLQENLKRISLGWVQAVNELPADELFDRVLVDAPCSNTGVLRRRPDARWRWCDAQLAEITSLQERILDAASAHVAPGGVIVWSTCSNEPEENEDRVAAFLASHSDFSEIGRRVSLPFESGMDGAFACALKRG